MDRQSVVEHAVRTMLSAVVKAAREDDLDACARSLDEAVTVYESNPSYVHAPCSHFHLLVVFVRAARSAPKELGQAENQLWELGGRIGELGGRLDALRQAIH